MSQVVSQETKKMTSSSMKMTSSSSSSTSVKKVMSSSSAQSVMESHSNGQSSMSSQSSSSFQSSQSSSSTSEMLTSGGGADLLPSSDEMSQLMSQATEGVSKMMSSSSTMMSSSSKSVMKSSSSKLSAINVTSGTGSFLDSVSPDITKGMQLDMDKLFNDMDGQMQSLRSQLHLSPLTKLGDADELIKLDAKSLQDYVDDIEKDKYKFNFDVHEFQSESVNVKADGNKIEVHGKKIVKKDGDEQSEEYSKTYELPEAVDPKMVSSSMYKDGVLTVELPMEKPVETHTVEATIKLDG